MTTNYHEVFANDSNCFKRLKLVNDRTKYEIIIPLSQKNEQAGYLGPFLKHFDNFECKQLMKMEFPIFGSSEGHLGMMNISAMHSDTSICGLVNVQTHLLSRTNGQRGL